MRARAHVYCTHAHQVVATNANAAYVNLTRNLWAAMRRTGEANLLVRKSTPTAFVSQRARELASLRD